MTTEDNTQTETWCPIPWVALSVRTVGDLRYCCHANGSKEKGLLKTKDGRLLNLKSDTLSDGTNAELLKSVRKAMLSGKRPEGCQRCYSEEDAGIFSRRQSEKTIWSETTKEKTQALTKADGSIDEQNFPLLYLDLRFGNKCNLSCRMCGPTESDRWYEAQTKVWDVSTFKEGERTLEIVQDPSGKYGLQSNPYDWYENDHFWSDLEKYMPKMERIYLAGGEPLLIKSQFHLLEFCIEKGYAPNITLEYNSNISVISEKILSLWKHFKKIDIGMSIDGVGAVNDYIRHPSQWSHISQKLRLLDQAEGNFKLSWASTIQIYNLLHLPEMMLWVLEQNYKRINQVDRGGEILSPHPLSNPNFLSIKVFSPKSKAVIKNSFLAQKQGAKDKIHGLDFLSEEAKTRAVERFSQILDSYIAIMESEDLSHLKEKFWHYTHRLDKVHGTSFQKTCPQAYELML